jgi:hypothetical protein
MSNEFEDAVGGEDNCITAAHEAGHILVAWLSPAVESVEGVEWVVKDGQSRVSVHRSPRTPMTTFSAWENGSVLAAGMAAEVITHQRFQTGPCSSDLKELHRVSTLLCGSDQDHMPIAPWSELPTAKLPPFEYFFAGGLKHGMIEVMRLCYLRARERIFSHRDAYARLRLLLIEKMDRTSDEITGALRIPKS